MGSEQELEKKRIPLTYATISVLAAILLWMIWATWTIANRVYIIPLESKVQRLQQELADVTQSEKSLTKELSSMKEGYKNLLVQSEIPALFEPSEDATVVGELIRFKWDYKYHGPYQRYIIEIRNISDRNRPAQKHNVLNPEQKKMNFPTSKLSKGKHLWRITPGYVWDGHEVIQGRSSNYRSFTIYASIMERIRQTKTIRVGVSPTLSVFNFRNGEGNIQGFDMDLIKWVAKRLEEEKLDIDDHLRVEVKDVPWADLLPMLQQRELDLVISSITSTKEREERYTGVRFTKGYFDIHQIFIQNREGGDFPEDLDGKTVGVMGKTTNEEAALFLAKQYRFQVDTSYPEMADVYEALDQNKINFALVDDVLARRYLKDKRFYQFGGSLDKALKKFYETEFGRPSEMYAIAVIDEKQEKPNLLDMINDIIKSKDAQEKLTQLKNKWLRP